MKINKESICIKLVFVLLLVMSVGSPIFQFVGIPLLALMVIAIWPSTRNIGQNRNLFYIAMIIHSFSQVLLFWKSTYSFNYLINTLIASSLWGIMLIASWTTSTIISRVSFYNIDKGLKLFFKVNLLIMIFQYIMVACDKNSIFPYAISMGSGDFVKGIFTNSSVSCIIFSFYIIYFYYQNSKKYAFLSVICMIASTYMSGIIIFLGITILIVFWYFDLKVKMKILFGIMIGVYIFTIVSPKNVDYVIENLTVKLFSETDQSRKIVSFEQTGKYVTSGFTEAVFGAGGGKFSSRTAFLTSGDYVSWFPQEYVFISPEFKNNHFALWNSTLLKQPFKDGTANQPFSFYNKIFGEYGLIGFMLFVILYLGKWVRNYRSLTFGKQIFFLMIAYFILDYWFEYITVIVFCELFIGIDLKKRTEYEKYNVQKFNR